MAYQIQNGLVPGSVNPAAPGPIGNTTPSSGAFTTLSASGLISPASTVGIAGTVTNDSVQAGSIGEYQASTMTQVAATGTVFTMATTNVCSLTSAAGLANLQAVTVTNSGGGLPTGLSVTTNYYIANLNVGALTCNLASSLANAIAGTFITTTGAGTGTQTLHGACSFVTSTNTYDICGLALTAGDWDVDAVVFPGEAGSVSVTTWELWIAQAGGSTVPTTAANILAQGLAGNQVATASTSTANNTWATSGTLRVSLATAGYLALAGNATFTVGTLSPQALLRARRVR